MQVPVLHTAVRLLAHEKLPLHHIKFQLTLQIKTLIKSLRKEMQSCTKPYKTCQTLALLNHQRE